MENQFKICRLTQGDLGKLYREPVQIVRRVVLYDVKKTCSSFERSSR